MQAQSPSRQPSQAASADGHFLVPLPLRTPAMMGVPVIVGASGSSGQCVSRQRGSTWNAASPGCPWQIRSRAQCTRAFSEHGLRAFPPAGHRDGSGALCGAPWPSGAIVFDPDCAPAPNRRIGVKRRGAAPRLHSDRRQGSAPPGTCPPAAALVPRGTRTSSLDCGVAVRMHAGGGGTSAPSGSHGRPLWV